MGIVGLVQILFYLDLVHFLVKSLVNLADTWDKYYNA